VKRWACWLPVLFTGCVTAEYSRVSANEPVDLEALRSLVPGQDDLTSCLAVLGAPLDVREYQVDADRASGMALIWYWTNEAGWGAKASTVVRGMSVSFEFDWTGTDLPGCVLWFDRDLKLEFYREGMVGQLVAASRQPSAVDQ
jgi:hypothetical protein